MKKLVETNLDLCVGCNRCTRECPVDTANVTYQDEKGNIKVRVDGTSCISCGACVPVCEHHARRFVDDIERFFHDLKEGKSISVLVAPSAKSNFPTYKNIITYLKQQGVNKVYDVSFGADLCIWAHTRYLEREKPRTLITQPCPAIVKYIEIHRQSLLKYLSPVNSPIACLAVYLQEYKKVTDALAVLSPCIAKGQEFEELGNIDYNVTFQSLTNYIQKNGIVLPLEETEFDGEEGALGTLFPMPGGLGENLRHYFGESLRIDKAEGRTVYQKLDEFAVTEKDFLPNVFDVLSCADGCNAGSACGEKKSGFFRLNAVMEQTRLTLLDETGQEYLKTLYQKYDGLFELSHFLRSYRPIRTESNYVSESDIQAAFLALNKDTPEKQNYNCGACGCQSCREMARRIALNINIPMNCMVKSHETIKLEHQKNISLYRKNSEYLELIKNIGDLLTMADINGFETVATECIKLLCKTLNGCSSLLWQETKDKDGVLFFKALFRYTEIEMPVPSIYYGSQYDFWLDVLKNGGFMIRNYSEMAEAEQKFFGQMGVRAVLSVPVLIRGEFWGFLSVNASEERPRDEEEVAVMTACAILIVSACLERDLTESLIVAREEALSGTQAKSNFLSRMSHEMRTPLNAIIGMTKIADNANDIEKLRYCLASIGASSNHLLALINDILDMSKIEAGKLQLDLAPFHIEALMEKISDIMLERVRQKKQRLRFFLRKDACFEYIGDELRLTQVISNLIANAIKFTPEKGLITVTAQVMEKRKSSSLLRISVSDTGIGMTTEQLSRLFTAFEQADVSITKRFGGTGLGLAISKSIIEQMNGRVWVTSELGKGSQFLFEVEFPRTDTTEKERHCPDIDTTKIKILAADRDRELTDYIGSIVAECGAYFEAVQDYEHLLERIQNGPYYDIILIDSVIILNKDGSLKNLDMVRGKDCVAVMATFMKKSLIEEALRHAGFQYFMPKPIFPTKFISVMQSILMHERTGLAMPAEEKFSVPDLSDIRLLLAEDIDINREIFMALLEATGVKIDHAENGRIAVEKFTASPESYDIIIMDIQMPEMDGYTATKNIRASGVAGAKDIPIVAMTANVFKEDIDKCIVSGMNDHLTKPIDEVALMNKIVLYTKDKKKGQG